MILLGRFLVKRNESILLPSLLIISKIVWSSFTNLTALPANNNQPIIVLTSQLDSDSFIKYAPSGGSSITGAIALIAIADALSRSVSPPPAQFNKAILLTFFSTEAYGFAGVQTWI